MTKVWVCRTKMDLSACGIKHILNERYSSVLKCKCSAALDFGFGTDAFTNKLYEQVCHIWGQDFSERMIKLVVMFL